MLIDMFVDMWRFDPGLAVVFVLAMVGFVATTGVILRSVVRGMIGAGRQVHTWMRDSGRLTQPAGATPDLGTDAPALVNLLYTHGRTDRRAVLATVLDLAARGLVTLHQPGVDPGATVVLSVAGAPTDLTPYERRVLDEVRAAGPRAALFDLPFLAPKGQRRWHRQFRREVQADARARGLTFLDTSILNRSVAGLFVPCSVIGFFGGLGPIVILVFIVAVIVFGERSRVWLSQPGRDTLAHWLGVREWLTAHEVFADLPPAATTVWGRYLAFGTALDVMRPVSPQ